MRKKVNNSSSASYEEKGQREKREHRSYSHSPYAPLHSEYEVLYYNEGAQVSGVDEDETAFVSSSKLSDQGFPAAASPYNTLPPYFNSEGPSSFHHQNSSSYSVGGAASGCGLAEGGSSLPLPFPSSYGNYSVSPRIPSNSSFMRHTYTPIPFNPSLQGSETPFTSPNHTIGNFPPVSYAPTSFSAPNPSGISTSQFSNGFRTETFDSSPSTVPRGLVEQYLSSSSSHRKKGSTSHPSRSESSSSKMSDGSSIPDSLPLCPEDEECTLINDSKHQRRFTHTCRLFPCYHGHIRRHAKMFLHAEGQVIFPEGAASKLSSQALASVTFSNISPDAPNAYRIYLEHQKKKYELFGDWENVKVHTFKRYLHQVCSIPPASQSLYDTIRNQVMDNDIRSVKSYGITEDSLIVMKGKEEENIELLEGVLDDL